MYQFMGKLCLELRLLLIATLLLIASVGSAEAVGFTHRSVGAAQSENTVAADIDDDGDLDILGVNDSDDFVWWRNNGNGTSWTERVIERNSSGVYDVLAVDLDNDAHLDLVTSGVQGVRWWLNHAGTTTWIEYTVQGNTGALVSLASGDVNGDGKQDIIGADFENHTVTWWENGGSGYSWIRRDLDTSFTAPSAVGAFDMDGDGDLDIVVAADQFGDPSDGALVVYKNNNGLGTSWTPIVAESDVFLNLVDLDAADVDGDGDLDLGAVGFTTDYVAWWENNGNASSWTAHQIDFSIAPDRPHGFAFGDIDKDGDIDAVGSTLFSGQVVWWENRGSSWTRHLVANQPALDVFLVDFGQDQDLDILVAGFDNTGIDWYQSDATTNATPCVPSPDGAQAWYPMDEGNGSLTADIAGNNDGTRINGPVTLATGKVFRSLGFDGVDDYVRVPDHPSLDFGTGDFTIEGWVRTSDRNAVIASKRQFSIGNYTGYLFMVSNGRLLLQIADSANGWLNYFDNSGPRVDDGAWHHVAVRVDRNSTIGGRFYIDGQVVYTFNPTGRSGNTSNSARLEIGRTTGGGDNLDGYLDELALYDRLLTTAEIRGIYEAGSWGKCKTGQSTPPLSLTMSCVDIGPNIFRCTASPSGGALPFLYNWSFVGNGTISPAGQVAIVELGSSCTSLLNAVSVTVTDGAGSTASAQDNVSCGCVFGPCTGGPQ